MNNRRDFLKTSSALAIGAGSANAVAGSDITMAEAVEDKVKIEFYKQKGLEQVEPDMLSYFRRNPYVSSCYASYISQLKEKMPHYFESVIQSSDDYIMVINEAGTGVEYRQNNGGTQVYRTGIQQDANGHLSIVTEKVNLI